MAGCASHPYNRWLNRCRGRIRIARSENGPGRAASWSEDMKALWAVQAVYVVHRNVRQASSRVGGTAAPLGVSRVFMASPAPRRLRSYPPRAVESRPDPSQVHSVGDLGDKAGPGPVLLRARQVAPQGTGDLGLRQPPQGEWPEPVIDTGRLRPAAELERQWRFKAAAQRGCRDSRQRPQGRRIPWSQDSSSATT